MNIISIMIQVFRRRENLVDLIDLQHQSSTVVFQFQNLCVNLLDLTGQLVSLNFKRHGGVFWLLDDMAGIAVGWAFNRSDSA